MSEQARVNQAVRDLPAVHRVLAQCDESVTGDIPHELLVETVQRVVERHRQQLLDQPATVEMQAPTVQELCDEVRAEVLSLMQPTLRRVVNATGVVLHTNLGRALLSDEARARLQELGGYYTNLEYDLQRGERGSRYTHVADLLCRVTGAEAALVVNNNAAAVLLVLSVVAHGGEVVVSRGELVEIGGSFRIPDVMAQSGARLVEVGTTNKTHLDDYRSAISEATRALMKVHTSNYRVVGFTDAVETADLVALGREVGLPVIEDLGSGVLVDLTDFGLEPEPKVQSAVAAGVDAVTFSGDKLLGGPQAGIILGSRDFVERCKRHPLTRALRVDKLTIAALEETLLAYQRGAESVRTIPIFRLLGASGSELRARARELAQGLEERWNALLEVELRSGHSQVGGGALPLARPETMLVAVRPRDLTTSELEQRVRLLPEVPVIARIHDDWLLLDPRTLLDGDIERVMAAFIAAFTQ